MDIWGVGVVLMCLLGGGVLVVQLGTCTPCCLPARKGPLSILASPPSFSGKEEKCIMRGEFSPKGFQPFTLCPWQGMSKY